MAISGAKWSQVVPSGVKLYQIAPSGAKWRQVAPIGAKWRKVEPYILLLKLADKNSEPFCATFRQVAYFLQVMLFHSLLKNDFNLRFA